jgi:multicomponent Na+:H+ antiporter subunit G
MFEGALGVVGYVLAAVGLAVVVLAVYGMLRLPDVYMQLHAASKAGAFGVIAVLAASVGTGDLETIGRAALIAVFLLITAPVSSHAIAAAARAREAQGEVRAARGPAPSERRSPGERRG